MGWKEYGLAAMAADMKSDGRTYYDAHAVVINGSVIANAYLDGDDSTDPFALLEGKTSCHTGWLKSAGMLLPMGYLISEGYAPVVGSEDDIESLRSTIYSYFNEDASIPDSEPHMRRTLVQSAACPRESVMWPLSRIQPLRVTVVMKMLQRTRLVFR